jgi:NAD(P)-dependent dehydrogenase (short-subunit alcohol dehydrogenase family)
VSRAVTLLRDELLTGRSVAAAGPLREPIRHSLERLGAGVASLGKGLDDDAAEAWARANSPLDGLVYDGSAPFGEGGRDGLLEVLEQGWTAIRAVAAGAMIPAGAGGRIVLIAPAADAHPQTEAARAAMENMARTLSIEWARHAVTVTTIAPGRGSGEAEIATLIGFLLSPAGGYFSGCRFELDGDFLRRAQPPP